MEYLAFVVVTALHPTWFVELYPDHPHIWGSNSSLNNGPNHLDDDSTALHSIVNGSFAPDHVADFASGLHHQNFIQEGLSYPILPSGSSSGSAARDHSACRVRPFHNPWHQVSWRSSRKCFWFRTRKNPHVPSQSKSAVLFLFYPPVIVTIHDLKLSWKEKKKKQRQKMANYKVFHVIQFNSIQFIS